MKKMYKLVLSALLLTSTPGVMTAQVNNYGPTASKDLYDFSKYQLQDLVDYFADLYYKEGRKFPTDKEFRDKFGVDPEFLRSHTRLRSVLKGTENPLLKSNLREDRHVWMNLPSGVGKGTGGFPSGNFDNDPYSMWQYTELFGSWNHGLFQAPGSWADAAHKHGTSIMSGIMFFDTTGGRTGGSGNYLSLLRSKNADGSYKYVKPYIHILMYLGQDGINYNWEASGYSDAETVAFHKALRNYATEVGFHEYRQGIYTSISSYNQGYVNNWLYDFNTKKYIGDIMLNYAGSDFADTRGTSGKSLKTATGKYDHLYSGVWIVTMNRSWQSMKNNNTNLCLWGEHGESRFTQYNTGKTTTEKMANFQKFYEVAFSGTSRNAAIQDAWNIGDFSKGYPEFTFGGISQMIPERTTLKQNLPFQTYFNTGAGERYYYKGKTATKSPWYSMGAQDYQPTYRWLQYETGTKNATSNVNVELSYDDAYMGGTSLKVTGATPATGVDLLLYRGLLTISSTNPIAKLALKKLGADRDSKISLILHKRGANETEYLEYPAQALASNSWEEQSFNLTGLAQGDVIDMIGLRIKGTSESHEVFVGGIGLYDDTKVADKVEKPTNLRAEVKAETNKSMSVKIAWDMPMPANATRKDYGLAFNDELGVDHYEIFYKSSKDGKVTEYGRTSSWATYIPTLEFEKTKDEEGYEEPYIGVRAVSTDLKTKSDVTWITVERAETYELPVKKDDRYCKSEIDKNKEGYQIAIVQRYLELVSTEGASGTNLNYTSNNPDTDGDNYVDATDIPFSVRQGDNLTFKFKAYNTSSLSKPDGIRFTWAATYIDWNNSGTFEADGDEAIDALTLGTARKSTLEFETTGITKQFQVPTDATPGKVRVRIVFTDAWFPKPTPCGGTQKGFTIDFDMTITGDNPGRAVVDNHDKGEAEDLKDEVKNTPVDFVSATAMPRLYPNPVVDVLNLENVDAAWIFSLDGTLLRSVRNVNSVNLSDLVAGTYIVKTETNNVTRTQKIVKK